MPNRINHFLMTLGPEGQNAFLTVVVAILRGLLNHDGLWTVIIDSILCAVFSLSVLHTNYFANIYANNHDVGILVSMVVGGVGSKYLLKTLQNIFETFISKKVNNK